MGFDVLYFPPIHPIGEKNRKGKNNALTHATGRTGQSVRHRRRKPAGTMRSIPNSARSRISSSSSRAARKHGLELALDFAVQCSPDHPWLKQHPEWFAWRPDGSMRYAENPPKKYEDIVNVDFYAKDAKPALWIALRDVVAFWLKNGVKIFRVDNPHTKPLPFWEWLIADMRAIDPDVIFLSEAFTRPKMMYRLAKIGFSQSYTYFTWRNTRSELETYLTELNARAGARFLPAAFLRQHARHQSVFPADLRTRRLPHPRGAGGDACPDCGACTPVSNCANRPPLPGKEEYLDSEKVRTASARLERARQHHRRDHAAQPHPPRESGAAHASGYNFLQLHQ